MTMLETEPGPVANEDDQSVSLTAGPRDVVQATFIAHYGRLVGLAQVMVVDAGVAEELVQEAFARTWAKWDRQGRVDDPIGYLWRSVTNLGRGSLRRRAVRERSRSAPAIDGQDDRDLGRRIEVMEVLNRLPKRQRDVVILRFYLDLSVHQVADVLDISEGTVKSHLHRATAALRTHIEEGG